MSDKYMPRVEIPAQLEHVLRYNGNSLQISAHCSARETECCKFIVESDKGCGKCGERFSRFVSVTPYLPFNAEWYTTFFEYCGQFKNCQCPPAYKSASMPETPNMPNTKATIDGLLELDKQRMMNGCISEEEFAWRVHIGFLHIDEAQHIADLLEFEMPAEGAFAESLETAMENAKTPTIQKFDEVEF